MKKLTRRQTRRNRKIVKFSGLTLFVAGLTCAFLFASTLDGYKLPIPLAVVGIILMAVGAAALNLVDQVEMEMKNR